MSTALLLAALMLSANPSQPAKTLPDGLPPNAHYLLIETQDGLLTGIRYPSIHSLAGKNYLVGIALDLGQTPEDLAFRESQQWIRLDRVRRFSVMSSEAALQMAVSAAGDARRKARR